jgi:hypothetical protein
MARTGRPVLLNSRLKSEPVREGDGRDGQWSPYQLHAMDAKFCRAIERAFARGDERPDAAANARPATHLK